LLRFCLFQDSFMPKLLSSLLVAGVALLTPAAVSAQVGPGQTRQLMLDTRPAPDARKPSGELNTLNELFAAIRACWKPPSYENARAGMQMTIRFSLNRDGRLIGPPMVTYSTPEVTPRTREIYRDALMQSLEACTPFPLTGGLGGAVAGRPISARVVDQRKAVPEMKV
jgi:hypothetical protein